MTVLPLHATHHTDVSSTWLDIMAVADLSHVVLHRQQPDPGLSKQNLVYCAHKLTIPKYKPQLLHLINFRGTD